MICFTLKTLFYRVSRFQRSIHGSNKIFDSASACIQDLKSDSVILVGGFGLCGIPEHLIRAVRDQSHLKNLTVVSNNAGVDDAGLGILLQSKQVKRMISSYVGENHFFASQYLNGQLEVELIPQGTLAEKIRAGGAGIPAFYTATGVDTIIESGECVIKYNDQKKPSILSSPKKSEFFNGKKYILEEAIRGDVALIKAWKADEFGNLIFRKTARNFNQAMAKAASLTIAEVEEIVPVGQLDPDSIHVPGIYVHRLFKGDAFEKKIERLKFSNTIDSNSSKNESILSGKSCPEEKLRDRIIRRAALEFKDGMYVNLGIGMPMLASQFIPKSYKVHLQTENGLLGLGPYPLPGQQDADLVNAGKEAVTVLPGASFFGSEDSFAMIRGGHLDLTILGAMEVSQYGDLANWIVPGKIIKGMGGAMDLVATFRSRVIVTMTHVSKDGTPKIWKECKLPLTAKSCVNMIITDLCVFEVDPKKGLLLIELHPDVSLQEVREKTGCDFSIAPNLQGKP